jgi:hypothetical protein
MEQLLADIVLMNEISILAEQVEAVSDDYDDLTTTSKQVAESATISPHTAGTPLLHSPGIAEEDIAWSHVTTDKPIMIARGESTAPHIEPISMSGGPSSGDQQGQIKSDLSHYSSISNLVEKAHLDQWEDPISAMNSKVRIPVHELLLLVKKVVLFT